MASNALLDLFEQSNEDTQILNQYASTNPFEITKPGAKFGKSESKKHKIFGKIFCNRILEEHFRLSIQ